MKQKKTTWKTITATGVLLGAGFLFFATSASGEVNGADKWLSIGTGTTQTEQTGQVDAKITKMQWPVASEDAIVTLQFGKRVHPVTGEEKVIDHICIGGVEKGTDIIAAAAGVVKESGFDIRNGNYLILDHGDNLETRYWHCETLQVKDGQSVSAGEKIATLGQTGDATGPCLSFAVYQDGEACDPMNWVE